MPCSHGTASSMSLCIMNSGVCTLSSQNSGEFSMYRSGYSQSDPPMRLCVCSYWNERAMPLPHRMPPYALVMLTTVAFGTAAANRLVTVIR